MSSLDLVPAQHSPMVVERCAEELTRIDLTGILGIGLSLMCVCQIVDCVYIKEKINMIHECLVQHRMYDFAKMQDFVYSTHDDIQITRNITNCHRSIILYINFVIVTSIHLWGGLHRARLSVSWDIELATISNSWLNKIVFGRTVVEVHTTCSLWICSVSSL